VALSAIIALAILALILMPLPSQAQSPTRNPSKVAATDSLIARWEIRDPICDVYPNSPYYAALASIIEKYGINISLPDGTCRLSQPLTRGDFVLYLSQALDRIVELLEATTASPQPTVKALTDAPETITIEGRQLVIETYLGRDFQPISPPDGKLLIASLKLKTTDNTNLPAGVEVVNVWVINGELIWLPTAKEIRRGDNQSSTMQIIVRDGPKWGPGIKVDVVVELKDAKGRSYLLRDPKQDIGLTEVNNYSKKVIAQRVTPSVRALSAVGYLSSPEFDINFRS
jgi:hypothetical protein